MKTIGEEDQNSSLLKVNGEDRQNTDSNIPQSNLLAPKEDPKPTFYAWVCLILILIISIGNQWQRYTIAYAYGVGKDDKYKDDPDYAIQTAYNELTPTAYGLLSGLAFTMSFSICGIFAGYISDKTNRRLLMAAACILWSSCTVFTGIINSYPVLFVLRFGLGIFESAFNPCAYSIISDLFAPSYRTTANSIFNLGIYFGGALASLSTLLITSFGWRTTYQVIGFIGIGAGILGFIVIQEPKRGAFEVKAAPTFATQASQKSPLQKFTSAASELFIVPTCRYATIAGSFRFFGGYAIGFFMPSYFGGIYPDDKANYAILNSVVVSFCGFVSALSGGVISDKGEKKGIYMSKAYICIFAGAAGIPMMMGCTLLQSNFYLSIGFLAMEYLVAECWVSPAITMVMNTISPENKGFAVSAYLFCCTIAGTFSTWLLGQLQTSLKVDDKENPRPDLYGKILCYFVLISYGGSIPFFYLSGREYTKVKKAQEQNN